MAPRKRPAARQPSPPAPEPHENGTSASNPEGMEGKNDLDNSESHVPVPEESAMKKPAKKPRGKAKTKKKKEEDHTEETPEATEETPTAPADDQAAPASSSSKKRAATETKPVPEKEQKTKRSRAKAKAKSTQQKPEPNPFEQPPDPDQQRVSDYFEPTPNSHVASQEKETQENEHDTGGPAGGDDSPSSSSSSSSSTSSHATRVAMSTLGEFEEDASELHGNPCMVQPDQVRSRIQMFSFPTRNIQRLKKHCPECALLKRFNNWRSFQ